MVRGWIMTKMRKENHPEKAAKGPGVTLLVAELQSSSES